MRYFFISLFLCMTSLEADTIEHYMAIANNIPQMEMKANAEAQAWARSAHYVLAITDESIAETLLQGNELAKERGEALFCLPNGVSLDANTLGKLIMQTYQALSSQKNDKSTMTVSQIAWLGVTKNYPCVSQSSAKSTMEHSSSSLE